MRPGVYQLPIEPDSLNSGVLVGAKAGVDDRGLPQRWSHGRIHSPSSPCSPSLWRRQSNCRTINGDPQRLTFNLDMVEAGWGALSVGAGFIPRMGRRVDYPSLKRLPGLSLEKPP
jgi:hypothetical protein